MNDFVFDPANEEGDNFDLVPSGEYVAEIIDAAIKVPQSDIKDILSGLVEAGEIVWTADGYRRRV